MSNDGDGTIRKSDMGKIITFVNDGLLELATNFKLAEKIVHVELHEHITNYHLIPKFAESQQPQNDVDIAYIHDMDRTPFKGDVLKILAVWDNQERERQLNDESDLRSVFTLVTDMITVPYPESGTVLFIHYKPKPQLITSDNLDQELDIPEYLVPALRMYVAHKVFMSIGTSDSIRTSREYQNHYIQLTHEIQDADAVSDSRFVENSFNRRGWV